MSNLNYNYGKSVVQKLQVTSGATTGYVLTSDSSGNALWQSPIIFTGNTSGDCITDLYITNLHGCSPIIIHDSINSYGSSAIGINAFAFGDNTSATGDYSHAEGSYTTANGYASHAEGEGTQANGSYSHTEGVYTQANGYISHAEGYSSVANGAYSHTEGQFTIANGNTSHAEGNSTQAIGEGSHAEGQLTTASGIASHSEGFNTKVFGNYSHAEGGSTTADGYASHAEGSGTTASSYYSHAEGTLTRSLAFASHAEGQFTTASGQASHAEGIGTIANNQSTHAEGQSTIASGAQSHAEGVSSQSIGGISHAEGYGTVANGLISHTEGNYTTTIGNYSHAEGSYTIAIGEGSHVEGVGSQSIGVMSHAENAFTSAIGDYSHSEGNSTSASGAQSHAGGSNSIASGITSFIHSTNSVVTGARSAVIGGQNITGTAADTVYVPFFNIKYVGSGSPAINLGLDTLGNVVTGTTGNYGVFGISNSSGLYTYYTTLTLAMAAAVSGNVIEMFSDVTETGAVTITLKNGVNIQGNGHTYTLNNASSTTALIDNGVAVTCSISNITFKTLNVTETTYILKITGASKINGNKSTNFISTVNRGVSINNASAEVSGVFASGTRGADVDSGTLTDSTLEATFIGAYVGGTGKLIRCISRLLSSGGNSAIYNDGSIYECSGYSPATAIRGGYIYKCLGISTGGFAIGAATLVVDSTAYSSGNAAIYLVNEIINSSGYSTAGVGIVLPSATMTSCVGYSTTSNGIATTTSSGGASFIWNSYAYSSGAAAISQTNNNTLYGTSQISNCTIICSWDNVGGHGIAAAGATNIANCTMRVLNASAKAIYSASALTLKYSNNSFEGSTSPISTTITQGIVNTFDNKGNILI